MSSLTLQQAKRKVVGTKQAIKALEKQSVVEVYIAQDAEQHVVRSLVEKCQSIDIPIIYVDTMAELGKACGIDVGAASAAIVRS